MATDFILPTTFSKGVGSGLVSIPHVVLLAERSSQDSKAHKPGDCFGGSAPSNSIIKEGAKTTGTIRLEINVNE